MKHKHIINSLPLLASILGRKYGVQVRIGGKRAYTDGSTIQLPGLPVDRDDTLLGLVRGMIDHESAHIRDTDFAALKASNLSPLEKFIWNTIEDWRAENTLAAIFPGCRDNFQWLIKHLFLPKPSKHPQQQNDPASQLLNWLLITVRTWDVPELDAERDTLRASAEIHFPGLTHELEPVLRRIRANCPGTGEAIAAAREITAILKKYAHFLQQNQQQQAGQNGGHSQPDTGGQKTDQASRSLHNLLAADETDLPADLGSQVKELISGACSRNGTKMHVAVPAAKLSAPLPQHVQDATRQATTALRTRLQAMMQSQRSVRNHNAFTGTLNTHRLHALATGDAKIFLRHGERIGVNTAVHILLDSSGSMNGPAMELAGQACFAVSSALSSLKGINLGVSTFPGAKDPGQHGSSSHWRTVSPILRHNQKMHTRFSMNAGGGTPMDAALYWVMQQICPLPEPRKIILCITDGDPDDHDAAREAIKSATTLGLELYGIGIQTLAITNLLPEQRCRIITSINDLAPAMFGMLHKALIPITGKTS